MSGPPRDEPPDGAREFFSDLLAAGQDRARQLDAVDAAVRAQAEGLGWEELRACYEAELDRRGLPRDPLWVERKLEEIGASPLDRARQVGMGLALAIRTIPKVLLGIGGAGDPPAPAWMRNPADASFRAWAPGAVSVVVRPRRKAVEALERALREAPKRVGHEVAVFDVWFRRTGEDAPIGVLLGAELLGELEPAPAHSVAASMLAAERRGASATATATLARARHLDPPYLLVVDVAPAEDSAP